jgi:hypothetical protein
MTTYKEIQNWVRQEYCFSVKSCWIAHMKEQCGLPLRNAPNRQGEDRVCPCPQDKEDVIKTAFEHFGMI